MFKVFTLLLGLLGLAAACGLFLGDGSLDSGVRTSLYGNGEPRESTTFVEGLRNGPTTRWYDDGTLRAEGQYDHGMMTGEWLWQMPDGSRDEKRSGTYEHGTKVSG